MGKEDHGYRCNWIRGLDGRTVRRTLAKRLGCSRLIAARGPTSGLLYATDLWFGRVAATCGLRRAGSARGGSQFPVCELTESIHRKRFLDSRAKEMEPDMRGVADVADANILRLFHFAHHRFTQDPARDPADGTAASITWWSYSMVGFGALPYWLRSTGCLAPCVAGG